MAKRQRKQRVVNKSISDDIATKMAYIGFDFFNDTNEKIAVRTTPRSSNLNPVVIDSQESKRIFIRPGGFLKLWNYGLYYALLVE